MLRPPWVKEAVPASWRAIATNASCDWSISRGGRLTRSGSASTVEICRYPSRSVTIRPANGPVSEPVAKGVTRTGTWIRLTASFQ
ncbi:hypothetical protein GCM10010442_35240 [Kitasatospora kifunensis]